MIDANTVAWKLVGNSLKTSSAARNVAKAETEAKGEKEGMRGSCVDGRSQQPCDIVSPLPLELVVNTVECLRPTDVQAADFGMSNSTCRQIELVGVPITSTFSVLLVQCSTTSQICRQAQNSKSTVQPS